MTGAAAFAENQAGSILVNAVEQVKGHVLTSLDDKMRQEVLAALCYCAINSAAPPEQKERYMREIHRVLFSKFYPFAAELKDRNVAYTFHDAWKKAVAGEGVRTARSYEELFNQSCRVALKAMELDSAPIHLDVYTVPFSKIEEADGFSRDFKALASVSTKSEKDGYVATIKLNSESMDWASQPFAHQPFITERYVSAAALHEMTHVQQVVKFSTQENDGSFYDVMRREAKTVGSLKGHFNIYRCTLIERQAHLRHLLFTLIENGVRFDDLSCEQRLCRADLDSHATRPQAIRKIVEELATISSASGITLNPTKAEL